jgi:leucyl-tRNA synthetase
MEYKTALKCGLYDFEIARNWYRTVSAPENGGQGMHSGLVYDWIRSNALMLSPFTPHFSEHIWQDVLGEKTSVQQARFPVVQPVDQIALARNEYMRNAVDSLRSAEAVIARRKGKAKAVGFEASKPKSARIYVAETFPQWQEDALAVLKSSMQDGVVDDAVLKKQLGGMMKDKRVMPFCQQVKVSEIWGRANGSVKSRPRVPPLSSALCLSRSWKPSKPSVRTLSPRSNTRTARL